MSLFDTGIRPLIDNHLLEESRKVRDYGAYWSASSAGYCKRLLIMRKLGVPPVPEIEEAKARNQRVFTSGHIFHEWMQRLTKDAGISVAQELELQDEDLMIRGHFDDLVLIKEPVKQRLILYDYKTVNSQSFKYKKDKISHYHRMQLGTYMYMLINDKGMGAWPLDGVKATDLTEARILNISKDDLRMSEFQLFWDEELEHDVTTFWKSLNDAWKSRIMPPCTCRDVEGGFMGKRSSKGKVYNDFFWEDEPCSLKWYKLCKEKGEIADVSSM